MQAETKLTTYQFLQQAHDKEVLEGAWYDWFCSDRQLQRRGQALLEKLATIALSPRFDLNKTYVFFKNNCPLEVNSTYDDFRICEYDSGHVLYTVCPKNVKTRHNGQAAVWGAENGFEQPLAVGTWRDIQAFFMQPR